MDFAAIQRFLGARGWKLGDDSVTGPTGGLWIGPTHLQQDLRALYGAFARREALAGRFGDLQFAQECKDAMEALALDDAVERLRSRHARFEAVVEPWLRSHGMLITTWDFSQPSVRGTGRHPDGGVGAVEVLHEDDDVWTLFVYYWRDDREARKRYSWSRHWQGRGGRAALSTLGRAWSELSSSRPAEACAVSALPNGDDPSLEGQDDWLASLPMLRGDAG